MDAGTGKDVSHILILEDNTTHRELSSRAFRIYPEQFRVSFAGNLREARQIMELDPPDLIIADWILPDGKGLDILTRRDGAVTTPLIIMTSYGDEHLAVTIMKSGAIDYVVKSATMFKDLPHTALRALHEWENILERKRAEDAVLDSQKRLADILDFLPDAVFAIDNEGNVIGWNHAIERMTGVMAADMLGKGDHEYSIPFYGVRRPLLIDLALMEDAEIETKYDYIQRDNGRITSEIFIPTLFGGKGAYLWGTASFLTDSAGNRIGAIEVIRDITDRKRAEETLVNEMAKRKILIDQSSDGIVTLYPDGKVYEANRHFADMLGYTSDEIRELHVWDWDNQIPREQLLEMIRTIDEAGDHFETYHRRKDGTVINVEISTNAAVFSGEKLIFCVVRDITDRKRAETALMESEVRFHDLFSNMSAGVAIYEPTTDGTDFIIRDVNHAVETIEKVKKDEILGRRVLEVFPGVVEFGLFAVLQRVARTGVAEAFPVSMYHDNRIVGWRENYVYRLQSGEVIALYEDVTRKKQAEEALLGSEAKYRTLVENSGTGIIIVDREGTYQFVNNRAAANFGAPPEEIVGKTMFDFLPEDTAKGYLARNRETMDLGTGREYEDTIELKTGKKSFFIIDQCLNDSAGRCIALQSSSVDITDRKLAEVKLRESEERYRSVIENAAEGITVAQDGMLQYANARLLEMTQVSPEGIVNRPFTDFIHPDDRAFVFERYQRRVAGENVPQHYDFRVVGSSGKLTWVQLSAVRIEWNGRPATLNFLMDITGRKQAEEKLRESRQILEGILNTIPVRVFWKDKELTYLGCNTPFAHDAGFKTPEEVIGKDDYTMVWREQAELYQADDRAVIESGNAKLMIEEPQTTPAGDTIYLLTSKMPLRDAGGDVIGVLGTYLDITDRKKAEVMIRESEERLLMAQEIGHISGWVYNLQTNKIWGSAEGARIYGFPPVSGDFPIDQIEACIPERERVHQALVDLIQSGKEYNLEFAVNPADGSQQKEIMSIARLEKDAQGNPIRVVGVIQDITDRKQAEEALHATQTRYRALIQNSSDIIRILDHNGLIVYESESSERILGYPKGYLIGKNPLEYIHPDDLEHVKNDFQEVITGSNTGTPTEFRIRKAEGGYIWVDAIGTNLLDVPGVNGIVMTTRPIQQRKEAEQALLENQVRLATAMDIAGLVNWELDVATGMFTFDDRFYALYETTADREGGNLMPAETYMREFVYPDDRPAVLAAIQKILATTDPDYLGRIEHRITPRDGSIRTIIARFTPVLGPDGKVVRTIGANQDITDFKLMESEIRSLNTVLEQRVRDRTEALAKSNEALEEEVAQRLDAEKKLRVSYDEKVMLLKEIHHRVKNNLQIIASLLNLQSRYISDPQTLAAIRESQNRVKAMALVHEKLYRTENISHISLHDYIRFLGTGLFQFYGAKTRGIQFTLEISDINVDIDSAIPLGLIINELISNSLKYAFPEGRRGEIAISVKKEDRTLAVLYRDTGIGIPADLDWRDTSSLGLRLVVTLVDQMNGTVELDRTDGTQFTMVLHEKEPRGPS